jgi:alpha-glucosidase
MKALTHARFLGRDREAAVFDVGFGAIVEVRMLEPDIGRVTLRRPGGFRFDRTWSIGPNGLEPGYAGRSRDDITGFAPLDPTVSEEPGWVRIAAGGLEAHVRLEPFAISWRRAGETAYFLRDRQTQAYLSSRKGTAFAHFTERRAGERHYGVGDKTGPLDRTGRRFRIEAVDPCGFDAETSDPLYKTIPFLLVDGHQGAYGLFYDNLAVADLDLGCTLDNYHGLFRYYRAEDGDLDYYVIAGPRLPDVVRRFSWLTGGQAFAPRWSFGFACTSMAIADAPDADARVSQFIDDCRRHDIACDGFHFGSGYSSIGHRRYAFNWNRDKFPDPAATMRRLREAGMMPVTNLKPCLLDDHPRLVEARQNDILVRDGASGESAVAQFWDGLGFHVDFTNPAGRAWWRAGLEQSLLDYGVVSIWNDNNEYEIWDEDAVCNGDGRAFAQSLARPAQALLMTKLAYETTSARAPAKRPYTITRGGPAGLARYGQTWSGDNETAWKSLRFNLTQGLNMGLSGLFNIGHDVGGFLGPSPGPELLCRFVEFCSLWPRMVMNSWKEDGVVTLPWMHPQVIDEVRAAMRLRYRLMPYLYTLMWRASLAGEPPLRPLFYDFPGDEGAAAVEDAFMFGPDLLAAPVIEEGARERSVRLPAHPGGWYDWHEGRHFAGGEVATVAAPLGRLPLFARAGAMIPAGNQFAGLLRAPDNVRELMVFGAADGESSAWLYEDDGDTASWRDGDCFLARFHLRSGTISAELVHGRYRPAYDHVVVRRNGNVATSLSLQTQTLGPVGLVLL